MELASFGGVIKFIFYCLLFYYLFKFIMRLMMPFLVKKAIEKAQENMRQQFRQQEEFSNNTGDQQTNPSKKQSQMGEYIDYEEID